MSAFAAGPSERPIHAPDRAGSPAAGAPAGAPRVDLYAGIHKAIRCFMGDTLTRVGRMDPADPADVRSTLDQVDTLLGFCLQHVEHENAFVHPAIETAQHGASRRIAREHVGHADAIATLGAEVATVRALPTPAAAHRLYRHLALFVADNLLHMDIEETMHNAALWAAYDDAELAEIQGRLIASIPADEMALAIRWMQAAQSRAELAGMGPPA